MGKPEELKALNKRIRQKQADKEQQVSEVKEAQRALSVIDNDLKKLLNRRKKLEVGDEIVILDHAIVRYLERVAGMNIENIKNHILPVDDPIRDAIQTLGRSGTFPVGRTHSVVLKKGAVVTILEQ